MSTRIKVFASIGGVLVLAGIIGALAGSAGRNEEFKPQNEFKLDDWVRSTSAASTCRSTRRCSTCCSRRSSRSATMLYIAKPHAGAPEPRADRGRDRSTSSCATTSPAATWTTRMAQKWFPFVGDAVPVHLVLEHDRLHPAADEHASRSSTSSASQIPSFALYAATANISVPLVADARRVVHLPRRGHPGQGLPSATSKSWIPAGVDGPARGPIFVIEVDLALRADHLASASDSSPTSSPATC